MPSIFVADFALPGQGVSLSGYIAEMNREQVIAEFLPDPLPLPNACSQKVNILFSLNGTLSQLGTTLVKREGQRATLQICEPLKRVVMRRNTRYPCVAPVQFRPIRSNGVTAVWKEGGSTDISLGGLALDIPPPVDISEMGEVLINLSELWLKSLWKKTQQETGERINLVDDLLWREGMDTRPLRLRGKICYTRPTLQGTISLGMEFVSTQIPDNLRLARILLDVFG